VTGLCFQTARGCISAGRGWGAEGGLRAPGERDGVFEMGRERSPSNRFRFRLLSFKFQRARAPWTWPWGGGAEFQSQAETAILDPRPKLLGFHVGLGIIELLG
jgi:hypothetical protein